MLNINPENMSINAEKAGVQVIKELDREVIMSGAISTVLYRYKEWDAKKDEYGYDKYTIMRIQSRGGVYTVRSNVNITCARHAEMIVTVLGKWVNRA